MATHSNLNLETLVQIPHEPKCVLYSLYNGGHVGAIRVAEDHFSRLMRHVMPAP